MDRREFLVGMVASLAVSAMPDLPVSSNEAVQRKIDSLPDGGTLVFSKDILHVNPSWRIRKSIRIEGEFRAHLTGETLRPIFRLKDFGTKSFNMTANVVITSDRNREGDWECVCGDPADRPVLVEIA